MSLNMKETSMEYYLFVNHRELLERTLQLGYENVVLCEEETLDQIDIMTLKNFKKGVCFAFYEERSPEKVEKIFSQLKDAGIPYYEYNRYNINDMKANADLKFALAHFPDTKEMEMILRNHFLPITDYTGLCGNCHKRLPDNAKYCKYCGTKRGKGKFEPFFNEPYCVYGPPTKSRFRCSECGYTWEESYLVGIDTGKYCPECGKRRLTVTKLDTKSEVTMKKRKKFRDGFLYRIFK